MDFMTELLSSVMAGVVYNYHHFVVVVIMIAGLGIIFLRSNILHKLVGLSLLQSSLFLFFINLGYIRHKIAPIITDHVFRAGSFDFVNPLPQAIVLTAIVVGLATTAVGCCLVILIKEKLHSVDEDVLYKNKS